MLLLFANFLISKLLFYVSVEHQHIDRDVIIGCLLLVQIGHIRNGGLRHDYDDRLLVRQISSYPHDINSVIYVFHIILILPDIGSN
jgi:hypothetical protein